MELTDERIKREIARLAYSDPRKLFNDDGSPKGIHELDDDTAASICGIEVLEQYEGSGKDRKFVGLMKKYKLTPKAAPLDMASKIRGLYERDNAQTQPLTRVVLVPTKDVR
jgi:phage terminase small subunit